MRQIALKLALLAAVAVVPACAGSGGEAPRKALLGSGAPSAPSTYGGAVILDTPGAFKLLSRGGEGTAGPGGNGAGVVLHNLSGSEAKVLRTGSVDASIAIPDTALSLGSNPRTISADVALSIGSGLLAGQYSLVGDDGVTVATGLHVLPGVTLTLSPNHDEFNVDADSNPATGNKDLVGLSFSDGILIEGTVKTTLMTSFPTIRGDLSLFGSGGIVITEGGTILTRGDDVPGGTAEWAGFIHLGSYGSVLNRGTIDASGGHGGAGGTSRGITLESYYWAVYNGGPLLARGGNSTLVLGGAGGAVQIFPSSVGGSFTGGGFLNAADILAQGGNGKTGGGTGGFIFSGTDFQDGPMLSTGTFNSSGGHALTSGNGGNAGSITLRARGGETRISGALLARGGNGAAAGNGGNGAFIQVSADTVAGQPVSAGCFLGADLDTSGGRGATGGNAGGMEVWNNATFHDGGLQPYVRPGMTPLVLTGLLTLDGSGGDGTTGGGNAGPVSLYNYAANDPGLTPHLMSFLNEADLAARGGNTLAGTGGNGNAIFFGANSTYAPVNTPETDRQLVNLGAVIAHGGSGDNGGTAGTFFMTDPIYVRNQGPVNTSGGSAAGGTGGSANLIGVYGDGITINLASLTANGGASASGLGGNGSQATVQGVAATQTGNMSARGGNGGTGTGGAGGRLRVLSSNGIANSTISGFLDVRGGAGVTLTGAEGTIVIDGIFIALLGGTLTY